MFAYHDSLPEFLGLGENHPLQHLESFSHFSRRAKSVSHDSFRPLNERTNRPQNLLFIFELGVVAVVVFSLFRATGVADGAPSFLPYRSLPRSKDGRVNFRAGASIDFVGGVRVERPLLISSVRSFVCHSDGSDLIPPPSPDEIHPTVMSSERGLHTNCV